VFRVTLVSPVSDSMEHNGMAKSKDNKVANGMTGISAKYAEKNKTNGAPKVGTHKELIESQ